MTAVEEWRKRLPPPDPALSPWMQNDAGVFARWCDYQGAKAAIAELEAEIKQLEHFCARVCEPWQIVEETKAELLIAKRLNAKWMDERTEALIRAERAEKALADEQLKSLWQWP